MDKWLDTQRRSAQDIAVDMFRVGLEFDQLLEAFVDASGLERSDVRALGHVLIYGDMSGSELAARINMSKAGITALARRLEDAGFLDRDAHPHDARQIQIRATPRTQALFTQAMSSLGRMLSPTDPALHSGTVQALRHHRDLLETLGPREVHDLRGYLRASTGEFQPQSLDMFRRGDA